MPQQISMFFPNRKNKQSVIRPIMRSQTQIQSSSNLQTRMGGIGNLNSIFHSSRIACG